MAREGLFFFIPFFILAVACFYIFQRRPDMNYIYAGVIFFAIACCLLLFFRDPERKIPSDDDLILAPADGKIVSLKIDSKGVSIGIFLSVFNVHINRIPVDGTIARVEYKRGKFLAAFKNSASEVNERYEIEIQTNKGLVEVHQIAGILARRVVCRLQDKQDVKAGERFGLIRFGSRVNLFLPPDTQIEIQEGDRVTAGETIIGRFG